MRYLPHSQIPMTEKEFARYMARKTGKAVRS
jgi:hypothetical protein